MGESVMFDGSTPADHVGHGCSADPNKLIGYRPTRHQCAASCRRVFGDLVPIEQYRNGSDGRRNVLPDAMGDERFIRRRVNGANFWFTTTTTKESD